MSYALNFNPTRFIPRSLSPKKRIRSKSNNVVAKTKKRRLSSDSSRTSQNQIPDVPTALTTLKRKFATSNIPAEELQKLNRMLIKVKQIAEGGFVVQSDLDNFWNSWETFCASTYQLSSDEIINSLAKGILTRLELTLNSIRSAKDKSKGTSTAVNKNVREVSQDLEELIEVLKQPDNYSETNFQILQNDLNSVKAKSPTPHFKSEIAGAYSIAQKLTNLYKFRNMAETAIETAEVSLKNKVPRVLEKKETPTKTKKPKVPENISKSEQIEEEISRLLQEKKGIEKENTKIREQIERASVNKEKREKKLEAYKELIDEERTKLKKQATSKKNKRSASVNSEASSMKASEFLQNVDELEKKLQELNTEIDNHKKAGERSAQEMRDFIKQKQRQYSAEYEVLQKELEKLYGIKDTISLEGNQMEVKIYNSELIEREKKLKQQLISTKQALNEQLTSRQRDYDIDPDSDYEEMLNGYHMAVLEDIDMRRVLKLIEEKTNDIKAKIEKTKEKRADPSEGQEWLNDILQEYSNLDSEYRELKSRAALPQMNYLENQLIDKQQELDDLDEEPNLSKKVQTLIDETKQSTNELLEVARKLDITTEKSKDILNSDLDQPTKKLEQAYAERSELIDQKESIANGLNKLYEIVYGEENDESYDITQMIDLIKKKVKNP